MVHWASISGDACTHLLFCVAKGQRMQPIVTLSMHKIFNDRCGHRLIIFFAFRFSFMNLLRCIPLYVPHKLVLIRELHKEMRRRIQRRQRQSRESRRCKHIHISELATSVDCSLSLRSFYATSKFIGSDFHTNAIIFLSSLAFSFDVCVPFCWALRVCIFTLSNFSPSLALFNETSKKNEEKNNNKKMHTQNHRASIHCVVQTAVCATHPLYVFPISVHRLRSHCMCVCCLLTREQARARELPNQLSMVMPWLC